MAYFPDLTRYDYKPFRKDSHEKLLNVGWLDGDSDYPRSRVEEGLLEKLLEQCKAALNRTRGWHHCPFCTEYPVVVMTRDGKRLALGDAEIRVEGVEGITYAAPNVIYHYV
jgi:hypothetical protein